MKASRPGHVGPRKLLPVLCRRTCCADRTRMTKAVGGAMSARFAVEPSKEESPSVQTWERRCSILDAQAGHLHDIRREPAVLAEGEVGHRYGDAMGKIVKAFKAAGATVLVGSPGAVDYDGYKRGQEVYNDNESAPP